LATDRRSDTELWDLAVAGDHDQFGVLFERHARSVYNHCFRRTASWSDAEELLSAVFVEAWRRRREVRPVGDSALPWLLGVANNLLRNHRRSLRRFRAALGRLPVPRPQPDPADDVARRLADERQMRRVLAVVERMPRRDQDVLALCAWSGLTYPAAAAVLDIPVGTVRSRLARARARLAELAADGADDTDTEDPEALDATRRHGRWNRHGSEDTDGVRLDRASRKVQEEQ
jgi:RNA polymerase sigma factor (sigma-70 family)